MIARRILSELNNRIPDDSGIAFRIGRATAPNDGATLNDLIRAAEMRTAHVPPNNNRPSIH